jgi:uncharacterized BrkB/YihY/UPF0761 family membrane protein
VRRSGSSRSRASHSSSPISQSVKSSDPSRPGPSSRLERTRQRQAALATRARQVADRAQAERHKHGSIDAVYQMADRDIEVGGGIIAGALAYRLFIWLLPLALVLVAGLGFAADAASESPRAAAESLGVAGLVSDSIAGAAESPTRWYAIIVGVPVLLVATRSVLRVLIGAHRLVWGEVRAATPKPTAKATLRLLSLILCLCVVSGFAVWVRSRSVGLGVLTTLVAAAAYAGIWLLISLRLPRRGADWKALVPGALVFGAGAEVIQLVSAYVLAPYALNKQGTYGALGLSAALLVGLYAISRLMVGAAVANATLWERRCA